MSAKKLLILKGVTPPGFIYKKLERNSTGGLQVVEKLNICKPGQVIELDEADMVARGLVEPGYIERGIKAGIWAIAPAAEKVTEGKRATYGEYIDAASGQEKQNTVSPKADANDK